MFLGDAIPGWPSASQQHRKGHSSLVNNQHFSTHLIYTVDATHPQAYGVVPHTIIWSPVTTDPCFAALVCIIFSLEKCYGAGRRSLPWRHSTDGWGCAGLTCAQHSGAMTFHIFHVPSPKGLEEDHIWEALWRRVFLPSLMTDRHISMAGACRPTLRSQHWASRRFAVGCLGGSVG